MSATTFPLPKEFEGYDLKAKAPNLDSSDPNRHHDWRQHALFDQAREFYPPELIQTISFLAAHFSDDIQYAQGGPYDYSDQERDGCQAALDWSRDLCERLGVEPFHLGSGDPATYHQADELAGADRQPWPFTAGVAA